MTGARANWWPRAGATLIDGLILTAVALAVGIVVAGAGASSDNAEYVIYGVVFLASAVYGPVMMARPGAANGQTIGKQALGLRVIHADGGEMTLQRGFLRDGIGKALLGIIPLYTVIDVLVPLFDSENQAIHDKVGRTYVVLAGTLPAAPPSPAAAAPHDAWTSPPSAPPPPSSQRPVPPAPPPPPRPSPSLQKPPAAAPPSPRPVDRDAPVPDLGGFAPPVAPGAARPAEADNDEIRGPFGPSSSD